MMSGSRRSISAENCEVKSERNAHFNPNTTASMTQSLKAIEKVMLAAPDQQVSFTDPDSRSMATSGRGSGMVGYNVQAAVDTTNHLIVAHEVTNVGTVRAWIGGS